MILLVKKIILSVLIFAILGSFFYLFKNQSRKVISPIGRIIEKPLDKYTFENLRKREVKESDITIGKVLKEGNGFTSYMFYFNVDGKRVSGLLNLFKRAGTYPVIVMFRGFVDKKIFTTGEGTRHSGEVFAENGFITLAPDFLGYGESDKPSDNSIEERFQTYTTAATLLASIRNLNKSLESINSDVKADTEKIGIWGHSNGGHIAIATLEITGKNYPTVLWAPVSKPFPYSILYYTDEFNDHGRALRKALANFEKDYDAEKYSPTNFYSFINAPIELHQGTDDEAVPVKWSDQLYRELKKLKKDVTYYTYPGEDHNFSRGLWPTAIGQSISFYKDKLNP